MWACILATNLSWHDWGGGVVGGRMRFALAVVIAMATACVTVVRPSAAETLADAIRARGLTPSSQVLPNLDKRITSYAVVQNAEQFLIAYYVDDGSGALTEPLFVDRYDAAAHGWTSTKITRADPKVADSWCLGSAVSLRASPTGYYLGTHVNPSAGCTIVLSQDLTVQAVLTGWVLAVFGDGTIVYQRSQVHFAPTHYAEISLYDGTRARDVQIYPMKPYQPSGPSTSAVSAASTLTRRGAGCTTITATRSCLTTSSWATWRSTTRRAHSPSRSGSTTQSTGATSSAGGSRASDR